MSVEWEVRGKGRDEAERMLPGYTITMWPSKQVYRVLDYHRDRGSTDLGMSGTLVVVPLTEWEAMLADD